MIDFAFLAEAFRAILPGAPLTLRLAAVSVGLGAFIALPLALMRLSGVRALDWLAQAYVFVFRSTPLLVQIFVIYYGLGQFREIRTSFMWPLLRDATWCAIIALTLNTAAYASEIIRGGLLSVPVGQIEAARAVGMSRAACFRRIILPLAMRQALPGYGNELILMVKATSLASIITLLEITGLAAKLISETFRAIEVLIVAGCIYLVINFALTRALKFAERRLSLNDRPPAAARIAA